MRIVSKKFVTDDRNYWDMTIPVNHNFVLSDGTVVHNCGAGCGFSVERQFIVNMPRIAEKMKPSKTVINVEDSRVGWAYAYRELISMLYQGRIPLWDVSEVRPAGAKLKTFGGRASGPQPLVDLFKYTIAIFSKASSRDEDERKLTSIECHDLCCKIGEVVVSGGVRRSAEISLSNHTDERMRHAKDGNWADTTPWRGMANNSACYTETPDAGAFMREWLSLYESKSGERGIFNRQAAKKQAAKYGRRDPNFDFGCNPCSEIILRSRQFCNLSEVVIRPDDTVESLKKKIRIATIIGTMQSSLTNFRYLSPEWKKNTEEEALLGVSLTGIMDNKLTSGQAGNTELKEALEGMREHAVAVNKKWAKIIGVNQATAITCVKPSGCATLDTRIKTDKGILSFAEIFHLNSVNPLDLTEDTWIQPKTKIMVRDRNNDEKVITKLYVNGMADVYELEDDSGTTFRFTGNHKLETKKGWKRVDALTLDDEIVSF